MQKTCFIFLYIGENKLRYRKHQFHPSAIEIRRGGSAAPRRKIPKQCLPCERDFSFLADFTPVGSSDPDSKIRISGLKTQQSGFQSDSEAFIIRRGGSAAPRRKIPKQCLPCERDFSFLADFTPVGSSDPDSKIRLAELKTQRSGFQFDSSAMSAADVIINAWNVNAVTRAPIMRLPVRARRKSPTGINRIYISATFNICPIRPE